MDQKNINKTYHTILGGINIIKYPFPSCAGVHQRAKVSHTTYEKSYHAEFPQLFISHTVLVRSWSDDPIMFFSVLVGEMVGEDGSWILEDDRGRLQQNVKPFLQAWNWSKVVRFQQGLRREIPRALAECRRRGWIRWLIRISSQRANLIRSSNKVNPC